MPDRTPDGEPPATTLARALGVDEADGEVVIPAGHQVNVVHPGAARAGFLPSGWLVVDFGPDGDWRQLTVDVYTQLQKQNVPLVVILQAGAIDALARSGETDRFLDLWRQMVQAGCSSVWVLPREAANHAGIVRTLREAGIGVHGSAPDGACFVEVHTPQGITVGMPGAVL
jgi:pentatricopeptide repeat protein